MDDKNQLPPRPYIGVTGSTSTAEVSALVEFFEKNGVSMSGDVVPMIGFLVSDLAMLTGRKEGDRRYPATKDLASLLESAHGKAFATIHYDTKTPGNLYFEICSVIQRDGLYDKGIVGGVQLNCAWPPKEQVAAIKNAYPLLKIILQLPKKAVEGLSPKDIARKIINDYPRIDYLLLDPSGGRGIAFDPVESTTLYHAVIAEGFRGTIGFAGGLSGENVGDRVKTLKAAVAGGRFSIDAEKRLRDQITDDNGDSVLNLDKARAYISAAAKALLQTNL